MRDFRRIMKGGKDRGIDGKSKAKRMNSIGQGRPELWGVEVTRKRKRKEGKSERFSRFLFGKREVKVRFPLPFSRHLKKTAVLDGETTQLLLVGEYNDIGFWGNVVWRIQFHILDDVILTITLNPNRNPFCGHLGKTPLEDSSLRNIDNIHVSSWYMTSLVKLFVHVLWQRGVKFF